jgi:hypothetical protein
MSAHDPMRAKLVAQLSYEHFKFRSVTLADGVTIQICETVVIDDIYLPVTAKETFDIARRYGFFPLTRAVADQLQNKAIFLPYRWQPEMYDYQKSSTYLKSNAYDGISKFGAHKLWVLSNRRGAGGKKAVNYGFYEWMAKQAAGTLHRGGATLDSTYNPKQGLGGAHDDNHWDYSQLLQLMYAAAPLTIDGEKMSMAMALRAGKSSLTDEGAFDSNDLP